MYLYSININYRVLPSFGLSSKSRYIFRRNFRWFFILNVFESISRTWLNHFVISENRYFEGSVTKSHKTDAPHKTQALSDKALIDNNFSMCLLTTRFQYFNAAKKLNPLPSFQTMRNGRSSCSEDRNWVNILILQCWIRRTCSNVILTALPGTFNSTIQC